MDGDGINDYLVGGFNGNSGGSYKGRAYLYSGSTGAEIFQWEGAKGGDAFGVQVAGIDDLNSDGVPDIIIGARGADSNSMQQNGAVYAYSGADGTLIYRVDGDVNQSDFGSSLNPLGDVNGDSIADIIVGAPRSNNSKGIAYVISGVDGSIVHRLYSTINHGSMGSAVDGAGDLDSDGFEDVLVGAHGVDSGRVYIFSGASGELMDLKYQSESDNHFGWSVAGLGDVTGDGLPNFAVGAPNTDRRGLRDSGSVDLFGVRPFMELSTDQISAANGGWIDFKLDFPETSKGLQYKILISASGTGPTTYGIQIPLTLDALVQDTFNGAYPVPSHGRMHGNLNSDGDRRAWMDIPSGLPPSLIGSTHYFCAIAHSVGALPSVCSVAQGVIIL